MNRDYMIKEILICCKANQIYISGDLYFSIVFRTDDELKKLCQELGVQI